MPSLRNDSILGYNFSESEELAAQTLSELQTMYLKTLISHAAIKRLNMHLDPNDHMKNIQQDAEYKGEAGVLQYLLDLSDSAKQKYLEKARAVK